MSGLELRGIAIGDSKGIVTNAGPHERLFAGAEERRRGDAEKDDGRGANDPDGNQIEQNARPNRRFLVPEIGSP